SAPGDGHPGDQDRAGVPRTAGIDVASHRNDIAEHVLEVAGDRDFLDRISDRAIFDPESRRATRIVAGDAVDALAKLLRDEEATAHPLHQGLEVVGTR